LLVKTKLDSIEYTYDIKFMGEIIMKLLIIFFTLLTTMCAQTPLNTDRQSIATIVKLEGKAKVLSHSSIKKHKAKLGETLFEGDKLITYSEAKVLVELDDTSKIILNAGSELSFSDRKKLKQVTGEVYYKIQTRKASQGLKVETPFSIMGIKGTEFIVDTNGKGQIALNEGLVGIESLHANFELHKKKVMAEYEKFKSEQNAAFEAYKAEANGKIVSYVKAFDLEAGKVLDFSEAQECEEECESKVAESDMSEDMQKRFEMYAEMINE